jgi:hypothetical protein
MSIAAEKLPRPYSTRYRGDEKNEASAPQSNKKKLPHHDSIKTKAMAAVLSILKIVQ